MDFNPVKPLNRQPGARARIPAFTLIEMLVVIAIMGVIASLVIAFVLPKAQQASLSQAKAELQTIQNAIESYHADFGTYPPDNTTATTTITTWGTNQAWYLQPLFYELSGAAGSAGNTVFGGSSYPSITQTAYKQVFGLAGPQNSSPESLKNYLPGLRPGQSKMLAHEQVFILTCSVGTPVAATDPNMNPWIYFSSHPTNNPATYDLFAPVKIGTNVHIIGNF